ncbi:MAG: 3-phosphoshikimate 1-carboxyvinyltransferase [Candidatus Limnocylindrales bacterium]
MAPTGVLLPAARLRGTIQVPADKSIAHRALLANAVAIGEATVTVRSPGADVLSTAGALRALGVEIVETRRGEVVEFRVRGIGRPGELGRFGGPAVGGRASMLAADCGNSGTTMRLLSGLAASAEGRITLTGDASLNARPMERVAAPLRSMGARVETHDGTAPMSIDGRRPLAAQHHALPLASAQVLGAICFAALTSVGVTTIAVPGETRDHTERMLAWMGADITRTRAGAGTITTVHGPTGLAARSVTVPGDLSSAAAWLVAATIHPDAELRITGVGLNPSRLALLTVLREMGASIEVVSSGDGEPEPVGDVFVRSASKLRAVLLRGDQVPALIDELPLLAVAMAAAEGTSEVRDAKELRVKESDRIAAMTVALRAAGAQVDELPDGWRIGRGRALPAQVTTHGDHRIAMSMAIAALTGVASSVSLDDPACVAVSYPSFWDDLSAMSAMSAASTHLLIVDDAQWMTVTSVALIRHLVWHPEIDQLCVVMAIRSPDLIENTALGQLLNDASRSGLLHELRLGPFDLDELRQLVARHESARGVGADDLLRLTGGNPLFAISVLRGDGIDDGAFVPADVQAELGRHLTMLSEQSRHILQAAARLGLEGDASRLAASAATSELDVMDALDEVGRGRLLHVDPIGGSYRFVHELARRAVLVAQAQRASA